MYCLSALGITPPARLLAACLSYGALASHRSAAAMHQIDGFKLGKPEVVVGPNGARSAKGIIVHRSAQMEFATPTTIRGIPCTGLARTIMDLAAVVGRRQLEAAIDAVLRDRRLRYDDLAKVLATHSSKGRNGVTLLRAVLDDRFGCGAVPLSDWSRWVSELLFERGIGRPVLEHRVHGADGGFVAQVDLAYPNRCVAIELDSVRWHHNRESFVGDRRRRNRLLTAGWDVVTFTWDDYASRPAELCAIVEQALRKATRG